jgi:ArsR family transcriptional regulator
MDIEEKLDEKKVMRGARCLRVLGHPVRLQLLLELMEGERSVNDLARALGVTQSNLSQHLALLREKGILASRREGHQVFYSLGDARIPHFFSLMEEIFCR